ncbi:hypothetical protein DFH09DRAFT_1217362 [Mycena vulgaris]|nr:hypothetical protein DFH09DRAFT_1217362 [Mycena vulgaris]
MPLIKFCAGSNDLCYRCNKPGDPKLRRCARCHVTRYCSSECQKEDWKLHKPICVDHSTALGPREEDMKVFLKWLDHWRDGLLAWGAFSADLANQPPEYLRTHSYILEVERRPPLEAAKHSARSKFIALQGGMRTDDEMRQIFEGITDLDYRAQVLETFGSFPPQAGKLRLVVVLEEIDYLANIFPDNKARLFSNSSSADSRLLSSALAHAWSELFPEHVRTGNISAYLQVLQNLIQSGRALTEAALDVD